MKRKKQILIWELNSGIANSQGRRVGYKISQECTYELYYLQCTFSSNTMNVLSTNQHFKLGSLWVISIISWGNMKERSRLTTIWTTLFPGRSCARGFSISHFLLASKTGSYFLPNGIWTLYWEIVVPICLLPLLINFLRTGMLTIFIVSGGPRTILSAQ